MIYLCLGRREQGKTTLALYLTRRERARVVFDPRGLVPSPRRVTSAIEVRSSFDDLWVASKRATTQVVITPETSVQPMFERTSSEVKRWVREPGADPIAYVVDELRFVDPNTDAFDWLCRCATRQQVIIVATAHRPTDVPTDLRAIADVWCLFQTTQEHDLDLIETRCSVQVRNAVAKLKPREFVVWDDTRGLMDRHIDPTLWYVPLGQSRAVSPEDSPLPIAAPVDSGKLFE
jgi:hypothetical protein